MCRFASCNLVQSTFPSGFRGFWQIAVAQNPWQDLRPCRRSESQAFAGEALQAGVRVGCMQIRQKRMGWLMLEGGLSKQMDTTQTQRLDGLWASYRVSCCPVSWPLPLTVCCSFAASQTVAWGEVCVHIRTGHTIRYSPSHQ